MINVIEMKHVNFDEIYEEIKKFDKEAAKYFSWNFYRGDGDVSMYYNASIYYAIPEKEEDCDELWEVALVEVLLQAGFKYGNDLYIDIY